MKKNIKIFAILIILVIFVIISGIKESYALEDVENYTNEYRKYLELSNEEKAKLEVIPEKYGTTLEESNKSKTSAFRTFFNSVSNLPKRYNLAENYNIKVENQGEEGNCWTFASLETLETYLQIHGYGTFDFSENHLNYIESNLFKESLGNRDINTGGNYTEFQDYANKKFG